VRHKEIVTEVRGMVGLQMNDRRQKFQMDLGGRGHRHRLKSYDRYDPGHTQSLVVPFSPKLGQALFPPGSMLSTNCALLSKPDTPSMAVEKPKKSAYAKPDTICTQTNPTPRQHGTRHSRVKSPMASAHKEPNHRSQHHRADDNSRVPQRSHESRPIHPVTWCRIPKAALTSPGQARTLPSSMEGRGWAMLSPSVAKPSWHASTRHPSASRSLREGGERTTGRLTRYLP
jgi:hypothetical protein